MDSGKKLMVSILLAVMFLTPLLAACRPAGTPTPTEFPKPTSAPQSTAAPAPFNWRKYEGTEIKIFLNKHPYSESLVATLPKFTEKTGITVKYEMLSEGEYFDKLRLELAAGTGLYDSFMTNQIMIWEYTPAGWLEALDPYMADSTKTDVEFYKSDDIFPALLAANKWNMEIGGGIGEGNLWAIPTMVETYILGYRADLFEKYNLKPPETLPEMYEAAVTLTKGEGGNFRGVIEPGFRGGNIVWSGFPSTMMSYAKTKYPDFDIVDGKLKSVFNQPELVSATDLWVKMIRDAGPLGWTSIDWYDVRELFGSGAYGMFQECDFFAASFEDAQKSKVAGKVKYVPCVSSPGGTHQSNMATWGLGMSSNSKKKDAAWYFIQWATSPEALLIATRDFSNYNPTRKSVWEHPDIVATMGKWGQGTYMEAVLANLNQYARIGFTPESEVFTLLDLWSLGLQSIWTKEKSAQQALDDVAREMDNAIEKAGVKPGIIRK